MNTTDRIIIVGGGLAGALAAVYLGRAGHEVDVFERRPDPRSHGAVGGRSINLALSHRGICALKRVGLAEPILSGSVVMRGRMIHAADGQRTFQPYGTRADHVIYSISRGGLNSALLEVAAREATVRLHFEQKCVGVDLDHPVVEIESVSDGRVRSVPADLVVSADGAFSAVRRTMQKLDRFDFSQSYLSHGYMELSIPPGPDGSFAIEPNALHIWPRGSFMMIALPNADRSFTCTLFWPMEGPRGFTALRTGDEVRRYFEVHFPDAVPLMPTLEDDYLAHPASSLVTIRCGPWYHEDRVMLLGDAAHAVVPFFGQGMNAAFEDVLVLNECLERFGNDRGRALRECYTLRKEHCDSLADLAIGNFLEMRDKTGSALFRLRKMGERTMHRLLPRWYVPLYTLVTHTRTPYAQAVRRAARQDRVVVGCAVLLLLILWVGFTVLITR